MTRARNISNPTQLTIPLTVSANISSNATISVGNTTVNSIITGDRISVGNSTVNTSITSLTIDLGTQFDANTTGLYHTGTINAASFTVGSSFTANSTALVTVSNTATIGTAAYVVANGNVGLGVSEPNTSIDVRGSTPIIKLSSASYANQYQTTLGARSGAQAFLILGNNGQNEIRAGRTGAGGYLDFYTNNTVDQGSASDGTYAMRMTSAGYISKPNQPCFSAIGTNYTQAASGFSIVIPATEVFDVSSSFNITTGRFTAPVAGKYMFNVSGLIYPFSSGTITMGFFINGVAFEDIQDGGNPASHASESVTGLFNLAQNDIVDFRLATGSASIKAYGSQWMMCGYLVA